MPIFDAGQKQTARENYKQLIHNFVTSVKITTDTTPVQPDPRFTARSFKTQVKWDDFHCSIFHFLSGKTDRLLQERGMRDLIAPLGLTPDDSIVVQYVCDDLLIIPDYDDPPDVPLTEISNNLSLDDEVLFNGEWWKVKVVIPDSEGIQHTVFATK
jgi:hypothetical protein